jgi:hypothetical protein
MSTIWFVNHVLFHRHFFFVGIIWLLDFDYLIELLVLFFFFLLLNFVCIGIRIVKQLYPIFLWTIFFLFLWPRFSTPSGQFSILLPMFHISTARCQDSNQTFLRRWGGFFVCQIDRWPSKTACWFFCFFFPDSLFDLEDFDIEPFSFFF